MKVLADELRALADEREQKGRPGHDRVREIADMIEPPEGLNEPGLRARRQALLIMLLEGRSLEHAALILRAAENADAFNRFMEEARTR